VFPYPAPAPFLSNLQFFRRSDKAFHYGISTVGYVVDSRIERVERRYGIAED
jgi:hypothetical protein